MKITVEDFELLIETAMAWKGNDWESQSQRFTEDVTFDWKVCYWVEGSAASMILARTFLEQNGYDYQESYDENLEAFILLTNYDAHNMAVSA